MKTWWRWNVWVWILLSSGALAAQGQTNACGADGRRLVARRVDAPLGTAWELRQNCAHPEWPAQLIAALSAAQSGTAVSRSSTVPVDMAEASRPLLVHAGETVRLWQQTDTLRIEMAGVAEHSAFRGDRVVVQVTQQTDDAGSTVRRFSGTVRSAGDVEMVQ